MPLPACQRTIRSFQTWESYHRSPHGIGEVLSMHFTSEILFCGFVNGLVKKLQVEV